MIAVMDEQTLRKLLKEELKSFATKDDLNVFATKEDLSRFVTKDDLTAMEGRLTHKIEQEVGDLSEQISTMPEKLDEKAEQTLVNSHELRIKNLEDKVFPN